MSGYAGDVTPKDAWEALKANPEALLVDVRTDAEWSYVGVPDLTSLGREPALIPWKRFPAGELNAGFTQQVVSIARAAETPVYFLCRSGQRSRDAAIAVTKLGYTRCFNVAHGFEGDMNADRHRGAVNGWKVDGLPWRQS